MLDNKRYTPDHEVEIRENLYIIGEDWDEYWDQWKESIYKTLNENAELLQKENVRYCFESDLDYEKMFVEEDEGNELVILVNDNGLVIYESREKYTYGCDICGERKDWDKDIIWITSSYGVCKSCCEKLTEEEIERLEKEYE